MLATLEQQLRSRQVRSLQWLHCMSASMMCSLISCEGHGTHQPSIAGMVEDVTLGQLCNPSIYILYTKLYIYF